MYNLADACDFKESRNRMIRDLLIVGCNSNSARDKIVRKGEKITLNEVIEYLQIENSTHQTLQEMNSTTQKVHYASYDKKKSKGKKKALIASSSTNSTPSTSTVQKPNSTENYARLHTAKNILPCVKHRMLYVRLVVSRDITKGHASRQVIFQLIRNLILQVEFTQHPLQQFQKDSTMSTETGFQSLHKYKRMQLK